MAGLRDELPRSTQGRTGRRLGKHGSDEAPGGGATAARFVGQSEQNAGGEKRAGNPAGGNPRPSATCPCCGGAVDPLALIVDLETNTVSSGGVAARLPAAVIEFASVVVAAYPATVSKERLASAIWGLGRGPDSYLNTLNVHACRLRKALRPMGFDLLNVGGNRFRIERIRSS